MPAAILASREESAVLIPAPRAAPSVAATVSPAFCREATLYTVKRCFGFVTKAAALEAALEH